ncbi:phosphorylase b kinase regulatory subunit beta isoform X3 [Centropristis striata]|uniref:phosphorylase b kinase regulatory subunit beta isoform X3 n=1 Tax=Centropristis striata TaxID=184440 RepID=UPI0027DEED66|nr:phosphorylase b kinase regulatory subunit beta isoform X3 [Centropristis striata]XP_059207114.1 phosphorylase b kinase regulatory subunit beta isoform X3 [Centropristis striata]
MAASVAAKAQPLRKVHRVGSIYEPLKLSILQREDEPLWEKLDRYYNAVKITILNYQSPTTGLFPVKTCSTCKEAKVRDSLYCAASAWALALAYRRIDDDMGRTHELEHSAIKCMRGILYCYMRQADKVEEFKQDPSPSKCLHSVFNVDTGDEVHSYSDYHHLQIDAVSLFLLYLVEMICSGLQIIYNTDEVSFIQNLVFCVERAYRVPDYGMWERGSKYNNGSTELHSSSVGLAKAALEAINGFNLFGNQGCSWSVIFVDLDAHNRNRQTLCSLLPRESRSHNTDAALLPTISYPAFAVDDDALYSQTLDKIVRKLRGKYGFKRFLRDGYRTTNEDKDRRYYKPAEMKLFDGIECEFPIFFIYMMIDGVFRGNKAQVKEYQELLEPIIFQSYEGHAVIPKYYYVPADFVEAEQKQHGSQKRFPSNSGRDGMIFLCGQALFNIAKLLVDELISPKDIDPIHRYVPRQDQRNVSMRYSNQGPIENDVVIHVALIAESQRLQVFLNTYGIQTQTPQQVEPIQIWPQKELVKAYRFLAINKKLGLSGRPERPVGCIGTCKIYRILGKTVVCYPIVFDLSDFYLSQDVMLLIDDIKNALQFIKQCWKMQGRPLFLVLIREDNIKGSRFNPVLDMLASFKKGNIGGVKVHVDRLQTLISGAVVEQLDFLRVNEAEIPEFKSFEELELPKHSKVKRQMSTPNASDLEQQPEINVEEWLQKPTNEIIQKFHDCDCLASQAQLAGILLRREGPDFLAKDENLMDELERIYRRAGSRKLWLAVRHAAAIIEKFASSIAPHITTILVHGKQVTLGLFGQEEEVISNPLSPGVIKGIIYNKCSPHGGQREAVLQQELVIHIGWIISNNPELFSGMLKIRVGWIVQAMKHELKIRAGDMPPQDIYQLSPSDIKQLLLDVLQPQHTGRSWLNRRQIDGSLNRTPLGFYDRVWQILERTPNGIMVAETHLPQQPTLSDMTMYEMNFSLLVEDMLKKIVLPEYRQIIVELLMVVSIVLERNPELEFSDKVNLDALVKEAFNDFQRDRSHIEGIEKQDDMEAFYNTTPVGKRGTSSYLTKAVMILLLQGDVKPCKDDPCSVS